MHSRAPLLPRPTCYWTPPRVAPALHSDQNLVKGRKTWVYITACQPHGSSWALRGLIGACATPSPLKGERRRRLTRPRGCLPDQRLPVRLPGPGLARLWAGPSPDGAPDAKALGSAAAAATCTGSRPRYTVDFLSLPGLETSGAEAEHLPDSAEPRSALSLLSAPPNPAMGSLVISEPAHAEASSDSSVAQASNVVAVTGFGEFMGVPHNPTEALVRRLRERQVQLRQGKQGLDTSEPRKEGAGEALQGACGTVLSGTVPAEADASGTGISCSALGSASGLSEAEAATTAPVAFSSAGAQASATAQTLGSDLGLCAGWDVGRCSVLNVAGEGALPSLMQTLEDPWGRAACLDPPSNHPSSKSTVHWSLFAAGGLSLPAPVADTLEAAVLREASKVLTRVLGRGSTPSVAFAPSGEACKGGGFLPGGPLFEGSSLSGHATALAPPPLALRSQLECATVPHWTLERPDLLREGTWAASAPLPPAAVPEAGPRAGQSKQGQVLWLHLGVGSCLKGFKIETRAYNNASFGCPDQLGWCPWEKQIFPQDGPTTHFLETDLPVGWLLAQLQGQGFPVELSIDAGRFVCNYVYYCSLRHSKLQQQKAGSSPAPSPVPAKCLFVHVPPFTVISEEKQFLFLVALLQLLSLC